MDRRDLKQQITFGKRQAAILVIALLGIVTVILYVLLGFSLKFRFVYVSVYYPPVSLFYVVLNEAKTAEGFALIFAFSVTVWAAHVLFALSSVVIPALKRHYRMCLWGNVGFILLSAGMFLTLFFVTVQAVPIYKLL